MNVVSLSVCFSVAVLWTFVLVYLPLNNFYNTFPAFSSDSFAFCPRGGGLKMMLDQKYIYVKGVSILCQKNSECEQEGNNICSLSLKNKLHIGFYLEHHLLEKGK